VVKKMRTNLFIFILLCFGASNAFASDFETEAEAMSACVATEYSAWECIVITREPSGAGHIQRCNYGNRYNCGSRYFNFELSTPTCDSPNYIDSDSGECVPPAEICYTDLESMADECVLLREDDPLGENCVTDASGLELCLGDNPLCYQANGKTFCPDADSVCGEKNGSFQCVSPQEEGCEMFNGEKVCFDPSGDKVEGDSPDHPDNGGNLDGDTTNDTTDSRDPVDGGDPENQPNQPIDTPQTGLASEITARKSLLEQKKISASLKDIQDNGLKTDLSAEISESEKNAIIQNGASGSWDDPATGTWAGVDDHIGGIGEADGNALGDGLADGIGSTAMGLVNQGSCSDLGYQVEGFAFSLGCDKTQKIRDFLSWALYLLTVWALFEIVVTPATRKS